MIAAASEQVFLFELFLKIIMTATIVVAASIVVERSGPFIGALIAALPTAAGAVYIILALEHPPSFVAASAVSSIASNASTVLFPLTYALLAQRRGLLASLGGAFVVWFICAALLRFVDWTPAAALGLNVVVIGAAVVAGRRFRVEGGKGRVTATRADIAWRAAIVAICVVLVTTASHSIGSFASGIFAVFPVAMGGFFIILHPRIGGPAAASVAAHVPAPLFGLALGFVAVHSLAESIGVWWSYAAGLAIGIGWNALIWLIRRRWDF
jgi:uncharacterized membrane protein (GlpM family)